MKTKTEQEVRKCKNCNNPAVYSLEYSNSTVTQTIHILDKNGEVTYNDEDILREDEIEVISNLDDYCLCKECFTSLQISELS